jgi:hypothetical protein
MRFSRFAVFFLFIAAAARLPAETPSSASEDDWFIIELQGVPCGYMHSTQNRVGDEMRTRMLMDIGIARGDTKVKITADQSYRESMDGKPLGFVQKMSMGQMPVTQTGTVMGDKLKLVTTQEGSSNEKIYPFDPEVKFAWGQLLEQRKRGIKPGTKFSIKSYDPSVSADTALKVNFEVFDKEPVDVRGKKRELFKVVSTMVLQQMEIKTNSWVDAEATPAVIDMNLGIMKVRVVASTKDEAMKLNGASPEMFFSTMVKADEKVPKDARGVVLRLSVPKGGDKLPTLPNTSMQTFERKSDYEGLLTIKRLNWKKIRAITESDGQKMAPFLQASTIVDINDKKIKLLARKAVKGATTPAEKADALRKFVTDYINDKGLDVGFATASEVARNRSGDCSEHGVLLAALARAAGLPSRGVSGIVQVPWDTLPIEAKSAFGYHMWTQVYIGDQWVDIDGALRQTDCDPTHIALTLMPLNDEGLIDSVSSLLPLMGRLEIKVEKIEK